VAKAEKIGGWLTLSDVARRLSLPRKRVLELEKAGELYARNDMFARPRFDPAKVEIFRRKLERPPNPDPRARPTVSGPLAAKIFRMFGEGAELRRVVLEVEVAPDVVLNLRRQYADMGRDFLLSPAGVAELRELLDWTGNTEASLIARVNERLRRQYDRGRKAGITESAENHKQNGVSSGRNVDGNEKSLGTDAARGAGDIRPAQEGETDGEARLRDSR
jgi:hypothetical protein